MTTKATCKICGKPPSPYPNWIIGKGLAAHVGCLADDYQRMRTRVVKMYDAGIVSGAFGPWSDTWTDDDREMWNELEELKEVNPRKERK